MRGQFNIVRRWIVALTLAVMALVIGVPVLVGTMAQDVASMSEEQQKDWLTSFVQDKLSTPERKIELSNIDGALGSDVTIREITISDAEGVWLRVNNARLTWNQAALFLGRLEIKSLTADSIEYPRNAIPNDQMDLPPAEAGTLEVPQFPVAIILEQLNIPKVSFGQSVFGLAADVSLGGSLTLDGGNLTTKLDVVRLDGPGGQLNLDVAYQKEANSIDLGLALSEPKDGVLSNLLNIEGRPAVELTINGSGPVANLATQIELKADGQTALSGTTAIVQTGNGYEVKSDLGGPLSSLVAEPYRPFFGSNTALQIDAILRDQGGVSVRRLAISGGQLALTANAETTPDFFLSQLTLDASIADPAGGAVTLPVSGSATLLQSAQFNIDFGNTASEDWSSTLDVEGFQSAGFAASTIGLKLGGIAANLADASTRRVTFNGDGNVSGIVASEPVEAALGDTIGVGVAGLWKAGEPLQLAQFRVVGKALTAALSGVVDGLVFKGDVKLDTSNIAAFSGLAGRDLSGALNLAANGTISPASGGFDLTLDGTGQNLAISDKIADGLLAGNVDLSGRVARTEDGLSADGFRLGNRQVQLAADGNYSNAIADFKFTLGLSDLALLSDAASGATSVVGTAKGEGGNWRSTLMSVCRRGSFRAKICVMQCWAFRAQRSTIG
ncbi:hypothetical protein PSQ90_11840 [Devosia rhodophyticola]|uniref:Translocation/assembly module TamB n=1 Tax=Devosia rhodophyticola TaxID=3026423 RepID=A0ABY7YUR1_9HYPH|nr:hypothetical protein [Devosia rhodophyticola]WDR04984.1 hypothetical protein PSQ90_11840 [Devosia rhodophyticola]